MEKVGRCQLYFPRGFVVASAALTFVSPLDKSFGRMPKAKRAVRWHREGQAVVYQHPWAEGCKHYPSPACKLRAPSLPLLGSLVSKMTCPKTTLHGT